MTSSSAWLESLGRASIGSTDISKTNYSEFEQEDLVKAVNDNMDSVTKGIEEEATAAATWYNKWHANRTSQIGKLAELTTTGGKVARGAVNFVQNAKEFNTFMKTLFDGKEGEDKDIIKEDKRQQDIKNITSKSEAVAKDLERKGALQEDINEAWNVGGVVRDNFDTKKEARLLMKEYYPGWRDMLYEQQFTLADGSKVSLKGAGSREQYDEIDAIINQLFVNKVKEMGYSKGFMKKYIYKPMFEESKLNAKEWRTSFNEANLTSQNNLRINNKLEQIVSGDYGSVLESIESQVESEGGAVSYQTARRNEVATILKGVNNRQISLKQIIGLGEYQFKGHDYEVTGKLKTFSEYWGPEYNTLYAAAVKIAKEDSEAKAKEIEIKKTNLETATIKNWRDGGKPVTKKQVNEAIQAYESEPGFGTAPASYTAMKTIIERGENYNELIARVEQKLNGKFPPQELLYTDIMQLPAADQHKYAKYVGAGGLFGPNDKIHNETVGRLVTDGISKNANVLEMDVNNTSHIAYTNAKKLISDAFTKAFFLEINTPSDEPLDVQFANARAKGIQAATSESTRIFKPENVLSLNQATEPPDKLIKRDSLKTLYTGVLNNHDLDLDSPHAFEGEDGALSEAEAYATKIANGETPSVPAIWTHLANGRNDVDGHDLLMARLDATGKLKNIKTPDGKQFTPTYNGPVYSDKAYALLHEKNTGSRTYRVVTGEGANIAEAFHAISVNKDNGGYDAAFNSDGKKIDTEISQMNINELTAFAAENPEATIGMYNIPIAKFIEGLNIASKERGFSIDVTEENQAEVMTKTLIDQDLQDRIALILIKKNANGNNRVAIDTGWIGSLDLPNSDVKEINEILPFFKDYSMMQLENMLPDVAKAVVQAATT